MLSRTAQHTHCVDVTRAMATKPMPVMRPTTSRIFGTAPICWMASTSALISMVITTGISPPPRKVNASGQRWFVERIGDPQVRHCYAGVEVAETNKPKELVLVVEDETLIRMHSVDMIRDFGFEVIEAVNADEAVSLLETI